MAATDLSDALAAVEWDESQLPLLARKFHNWKQSHVGVEITEPNPQTGKKLVIFRKKGAMPAVVNAGVGSVINSYRSALDLLCSGRTEHEASQTERVTAQPGCSTVLRLTTLRIA